MPERTDLIVHDDYSRIVNKISLFSQCDEQAGTTIVDMCRIGDSNVHIAWLEVVDLECRLYVRVDEGA